MKWNYKWIKENDLQLAYILVVVIVAIVAVFSVIAIPKIENAKHISISSDFYQQNSDTINFLIKQTPDYLIPKELIFKYEVIEDEGGYLLGTYNYLEDIITIYSDMQLSNTYWHEVGHKLYYYLSNDKINEYESIYNNTIQSDKLTEDFADAFACYKIGYSMRDCAYYFSEEKYDYFKRNYK